MRQILLTLVLLGPSALFAADIVHTVSLKTLNACPVSYFLIVGEPFNATN